MRIAFLTQPWARALPPSESIAIWTQEVARRLAAEHEVVVWSRNHPPDELVREEDGVEYRSVVATGDWRLLRVVEPLAGRRGPRKPAFSSALYHGLYHRAVARALKADPPDVVHVHNFSQAVPFVRRACPDAAIVLHMHCEWLNHLDRRMIRRRVERADALVGCSDFVTDGIRAAFPEAADRCHTLYNGVDVEAFTPASRPGDGTVRFLAVGRISPEKGTHVLLDAFARLVETRPGVELHVVGEEGMPEPAMLAKLGDNERVRALLPLYEPGYLTDILARIPAHVQERITFHGTVPHAAVPALYAAADVLVSPSVCEEPFGMQNAEGGAAGLPVVTTRAGGTPEVVEDGVNGLFVPPGDTDALVAAMERIAADGELRARLGAAGRKRAVDRFSWDVIAPQTLAVYRGATSS